MTVQSVEKIQARYAQAREALWGKPRQVNLVVEEKRAIEALRRSEQMKWERQQREKERWAKHRDSIVAGNLTTSGVASARFDGELGSVGLPAIVISERPSMLDIAKGVLKQYPGVTIEDVRGHDRARNVMLARRHVIAAIRIYRPDLSLPAIGRFVAKDHTTCHHAIRKFAETHMRSGAHFKQGISSE